MVYDFHTHTFISDGVLSPFEQIRRAFVKGYKAIALTDHMGIGGTDAALETLVQECSLAMKHWDIIAIPGIELTHVPAGLIGEAAEYAKQRGARIVVVHGETIVEPVEPGTNRAAIESSHVDILAHPGLLSQEDAELAAHNGTFIEISGRKGHSFTNGHVAKTGRVAGVRFLVNSDAHAPDDLFSIEFARNVALGCGLTMEEVNEVVGTNPMLLLSKLGYE